MVKRETSYCALVVLFLHYSYDRATQVSTCWHCDYSDKEESLTDRRKEKRIKITT